MVWDWVNGRERFRAPLPTEARSVTYRRDGHVLAVLCGGGELLQFDAVNGRELRRWLADDAEGADHWINNGKVTFSPDSQAVLTWGMRNDVRVWDAQTGRLRYPSLQHRDKCHDVQFSPDGRSMVLASYDGSVKVRHIATGTVVAELPGHPDLVYSASFNPDGKLLVTACRDRMVRVWDWRAKKLACPPFEHVSEVVAATFTPDGRSVLSVSDDATARAWDWRTGKPVTPPVPIKGESRSLVITPDGKHAVIGGFQNELTVIDLTHRHGLRGIWTHSVYGPSWSVASSFTQAAALSICRPKSGSTAGAILRPNRFRWRRSGSRRCRRHINR